MDVNQIRAAAQKRPDWRNPGRVSPFQMEIAKPTICGPEQNLWFHSPSRFGARLAPEWFREQLHYLDPDFEMVWNFTISRWMLWVKAPRIRNQWSQGWNLLFIHQGSKGEFWPLDERVFARIFTIDGRRQGDAKKYFARIMDEQERDKERAKQRTSSENLDIAMESFDHSKIKVGYGKSNGSKFSTYHA